MVAISIITLSFVMCGVVYYLDRLTNTFDIFTENIKELTIKVSFDESDNRFNDLIDDEVIH